MWNVDCASFASRRFEAGQTAKSNISWRHSKERVLADIPYKALASCHQRASLVIRFRCRSTDAVAVLDGTFNIPLIGQTSYYNLTQTLDNHPILGIADIFTLRSEYEIDPVAIEFRYLAADHL